MILTTGYIDHKDIASYLGPVSVTHVLGLSFMKDFFASITDLTGGRVKGYETEISKGTEEVMTLLETEAQKRGANAVISIRMTFTVFSPSQKGTVVAITGYGTAVKLKSIKPEIRNDYFEENRTETKLEQRGVTKELYGTGFEWGK